MDQKEPVWHAETVSPEIIRTLGGLQESRGVSGFYLAGGTGLALRLGHRRSVDLDFFSPDPFEEELLIQKVQSSRGFSLVARAPGTIHARIGGIKVSFLAFAYPLLFPISEFQDVNVADPRDIACMKLSAIASRGAKRDFVDLYAVSRDYGLPQILQWFEEKFAQANYVRTHLLKSLTYFDDAEKDPSPDMIAPISWEEVKSFFAFEAPHLL